MLDPLPRISAISVSAMLLYRVARLLSICLAAIAQIKAVFAVKTLFFLANNLFFLN